MDLTEHLRIIWTRRWRVLAGSGAIALLVFAWSSTKQDVYEATALLSVTAAGAANGDSVSKDDTLFLAETYAEQATTEPVVRSALEQGSLPLRLREATARLSATPSADAGFVTITATGPSREQALALAQADAVALVADVERRQQDSLAALLEPIQREIDAAQVQLDAMPTDDPSRPALQSRLDTLRSAALDRQLLQRDQVEVVSPAHGSPDPVAPNPRRDALLAFLVALVVNAELMVLVEVLGDRFGKNLIEEVPKVTGLSVLAEIPRGAGAQGVEAFRTLRTNLMFAKGEKGVGTIAVVGVEPGCGRSYVAANIARSAADLEVPVLLIDADLRSPILHDRFGVRVVPGLTDLRTRNDLERVCRPVSGEPNLTLMPAGSTTPDPVALLGRLGEVLATITRPELIVVDTPPSALFADAIAIAVQCNATLVVIDPQSSRRRAVRGLVDSLRKVGANPIGVVVNRAESGSWTSYEQRESAVRVGL